MRRGVGCLIAGALASLVVAPSHAGAVITGAYREVPGTSPFPGEILVELTHGRWAESCASVSYSLNTTIDPILDPTGAPALTLAQAKAMLQSAVKSWAEIPTSYIDQRIDRVTSTLEPTKLDFVNEVTFRTEHLVFAQSVTGMSRAIFVPIEFVAENGLDFDGDGDPDFSAATKTCRDVDGDGDIEHPDGTVAAGTILDDDIHFFPHHARYEDLAVDPVPPFEPTNRTDLEGVAAHEFGHGFGLTHSMVIDTDGDDGTGATMSTWWFNDQALSMRTLHSDDIAWASYLYPEGTRKSGIAALQKGDIAFERAYSVITGEVRDVHGNPVLGAQPYAADFKGAILTNTISGTLHQSFNPATGRIRGLPFALAVPNGKYALPVPRGVYRVGVESADGFPASSGGQNTLELLGRSLGQLDFPEEFWGGPYESSRESELNVAWPVIALRDRHGVDFELDAAQQLLGSGAAGRNEAGFGLLPPGLIVAVRIPTEELLALDAGRGIFIQAGLYGSSALIAEESGFLDATMITSGEARADGTAIVDLRRPLAREKDVLLGTFELAQMHVAKPGALGDYVTRKLAGTSKDLFVVADFPDVEHPLFPGEDIAPTGAIFRDPTPEAPLVGNTYISFDGGKTFLQMPFDIYFGVHAGAR